MIYDDVFRTAPMVYNICSAYQRMKDEFGCKLHPTLYSAGWVLDPRYRKSLETVYRQYLAIAEKYHVPLVGCIPSRGAYRERVRATVWRGRDLLAENMRFVRSLTADYDVQTLVGCIDSAENQYAASDALTAEQAYQHHRRHLEEWQAVRPDFLYSGILPGAAEAVGIARAFSDSGLPYHIGFMVTDSGCLLDGTPLHDAICMVDDAAPRPARMFMCNCIHPDNLLRALEQPFNRTEAVRTRLRGSIANASTLRPQELEHSDHIVNAGAAELAQALIRLHDFHPMRLVGGCCGTTDAHMEEIVRRMEEHLAQK